MGEETGASGGKQTRFGDITSGVVDPVSIEESRDNVETVAISKLGRLKASVYK